MPKEHSSRCSNESMHIAPSFLCIGSQRAGTSWLYEALAATPDIWLPPIKELHFFDTIDDHLMMDSVRYTRHLPQRLRHYGAATAGLFYSEIREQKVPRLDPYFDLSYFFGKRDIVWYQGLFSRKAQEGKITGDMTPAYSILSIETIRLIREMNPSMKIVLILRDPIDRAWSQAVKNLCRERKRTVDSVPDSEFLKAFSRPKAKMRNDYMTILEHWSCIFPQEQIYVGFYDKLVTAPVAFCRDILAFLESDFVPESHHLPQSPINTSEPYSSPIPARFESELARQNLPMLRRLTEQHADPCENWYSRALSAARSDGSTPYPKTL